MGRKIFEEHGFDVEGRVLPLDRFSLFSDRREGIYICPEYRKVLIAKAEALLGKSYPAIRLSEYLMFRRNGNRTVFQNVYFERRRDMTALALAEYIEGEGRFADALRDLVWMILEETTWVLPAHSRERGGGLDALSYGVEQTDYIDLFSATTGAALAMVYYLCRDIFDEPAAMKQRILAELDKRIVRPYLDATCTANDWWMGRKGKATNNWCPWINSNVLTVCALTVEDVSTREAVIKQAMTSLDSFTVGYHTDGGCDEGPNYWGKAGGALFNACLVLYDMTDGYVNIFRDPLMVNMGEYIAKAHISGNYYMNFADAHANINYHTLFGYDWGVLSDSALMRDFWRSRLCGVEFSGVVDDWLIYGGLRQLGIEPLERPVDYKPPLRVWLDGICVAATREREDGSGLYLAVKGGHNAESHNHNDVGSFVVYSDGKPLFLDAGVGEYTKKTFSANRYSIWSMCSDYHNLPTFCGVTQKDGKDFCATDVEYDAETGGLSMELSAAYPPEAALAGYRREAKLVGGVVTVTDTFTLGKDGDVTFSLICDAEPTSTEKGRFTLHGRTICFDASLQLSCEAIDCSEVETKKLPDEWGVPALYRILLTASVRSGEKKQYQLIVR